MTEQDQVNAALVAIQAELDRRGVPVDRDMDRNLLFHGDTTYCKVSFSRNWGQPYPSLKIRIDGTESFRTQTYKPNANGKLPIGKICDRIERLMADRGVELA